MQKGDKPRRPQNPIDPILLKEMPMYRIAFGAFFVLALALSLSIPTRTPAADGAAVFTSLRCDSCHKPDSKLTGASLKDIVAAYGGDREKLIKFFNGESKAIIETDKPGMMRGQIPKIKALSDE